MHLDAISSHFAHETELHIASAKELTADALAAASPASPSPLSPSLSFTNPTSPISATFLGRLPSNAGSSSAHGSSSNGDVAVTEEDGSNTPSSRAARLLADVRAGKLESHEVLAALKITPTRDSDRRASDNSLERLEESVGSMQADDTNRTTSISSLDPHIANVPSQRPSTSSASASAKVKLGPRPSHSPESSVVSNVASLPAGVTMPKPPPVQTQAQRPSSSRQSPSPTTQAASVPFGAGGSIVPIVQSPASVVSSAGQSKARSTAASVMTLPPNLGQRKGSESSLQSPGDQQAVEKTRLMRALEMQKKKQARKNGDNASSAEPSPMLPSEPTSAANGVPGDSALTDIDTTTANRLHAATKSSPTLGSMINFPLRAPDDAQVTQAAIARREAEDIARLQDRTQHHDSVAPTTRLPDLSASGPATLQISTAGGGPNEQSSASNAQNLSPSSHSPASDGTLKDQESTVTPTKAHPKVPAPINTSIATEAIQEESQLTPIAAEREGGKLQTADALPTSERDMAKSQIGQHHSAHVSISTSISGASSFMDELEATNVEEAQPMTMMRSPVTPNFPRSFPQPDSKLKAVEVSPPSAELEQNAKSVQPSQANEETDGSSVATSGPDPLASALLVAAGSAAQSSSELGRPTQALDSESRDLSKTDTASHPEAPVPPHDASVEPAVAALDASRDAERQAASATAPAPLHEPAATTRTAEVVKQPETEPPTVERETKASKNGAAKLTPQLTGQRLEDPMKAIIEAEMGTSTPVTSKTVEPAVEVMQPIRSVSSLATDQTRLSPDELSTPADENLDPLSVSKSGTSGSLKKHPTVQPPHIWGGALRSASNPSGSEPPRHLSPVPDLSRMTRSASVASNASGINRPDSPSSVKKVGVGSRIADRIKALEKSSVSGPASSAPVYASSAVSVSSRKSSYNTPPGSSGTGKLSTSSPNSNIFARRFGTVHGSAPSESGRSERTIRASPTRDQPQSSSPSESQFAPRPALARGKSSESHNANYSLPPSRDGGSSIASQSKTKSSFSSWTGRRESSETTRTGHSRQSSVESTNTNSDKKKENKAKKLMKRMSGAFSPRKERSAPSFGEPIMEGAEPDPPSTGTSTSGNAYATRPTTAATVAPRDDATGGVVSKASARPTTRMNNNVVVGEINVQFPDTLVSLLPSIILTICSLSSQLWKRRHVELDGEGNLILAPSALDKSSRVAQKKYHISDFIRPYIPDQEREELPYSICLDFQDSSTLQCACQNAVDQKNVLQALVQFHSTFTKA